VENLLQKSNKAGAYLGQDFGVILIERFVGLSCFFAVLTEPHWKRTVGEKANFCHLDTKEGKRELSLFWSFNSPSEVTKRETRTARIFFCFFFCFEN
jgi:hypothetical protein